MALAVFAFPLAAPAWILLSGDQRARYWASPWVRWALWVFVASALPLLLVGSLSGPGANPIGLGLLFVAGTLVATALALIGIVTAR